MKNVLKHTPLNFSKFDTGRIKCSCLDVSSSYLVFGANTGSLYVYERETLLFIHIITNPGAIEKIKFSPDGALLAVVTEPDHHLYIVEHNLKKRKTSKVCSFSKKIFCFVLVFVFLFLSFFSFEVLICSVVFLYRMIFFFVVFFFLLILLYFFVFLFLLFLFFFFLFSYFIRFFVK